MATRSSAVRNAPRNCTRDCCWASLASRSEAAALSSATLVRITFSSRLRLLKRGKFSEKRRLFCLGMRPLPQSNVSDVLLPLRLYDELMVGMYGVFAPFSDARAAASAASACRTDGPSSAMAVNCAAQVVEEREVQQPE